MLELDHLAVSAATLAEAQAYVEEGLGVAMEPGGQHAHFGTHNMLLGLEDGLYLEAITIDPEADQRSGAVQTPCWFGLDDFTGPARLNGWVLRAEDPGKDLTEIQLGHDDPLALARGDLRWSMALATQRAPKWGALFPYLIGWGATPHPAQKLQQKAVALAHLTLADPQIGVLEKMLRPWLSQAWQHRVRFERADRRMLHAEFSTPHGMRTL